MMLSVLLYLAIGLWTALSISILYFASNEVDNARDEAAVMAWLVFATFLWPVAWVAVAGWFLAPYLAARPRRRPRPP